MAAGRCFIRSNRRCVDRVVPEALKIMRRMGSWCLVSVREFVGDALPMSLMSCKSEVEADALGGLGDVGVGSVRSLFLKL